MKTVPLVADAWADALARQDFAALDAALDPSVRFRALVPGELVTATSAGEVVACFRRWFGSKTDIEMIDVRSGMLVDRLWFRFSARVREKGQPYLIEQTLVGDLEDGRFATLDLLCSGFRPEGVASASDAITHVFDAGDLGCGTGLPREFRTRLLRIPIGHVLEVTTTDPSAREDLPSLARMLGHDVRSVETGAAGKVTIRVERCK